MTDAWIPLLSALVSGVVVKVIDHTFVRHEKSFDDAVAIRQELRDEVHSLHRELKALQQELDDWKTRFYDLQIRYQGLLSECQTLRTELEEMRQHDDLRACQHVQHALSDMRVSPSAPPEVSHAVPPSSHSESAQDRDAGVLPDDA